MARNVNSRRVAFRILPAEGEKVITQSFASVNPNVSDAGLFQFGQAITSLFGETATIERVSLTTVELVTKDA